MKVCWNCGSEVAEKHRFCMQCGADQTKPPQRSGEAADPLIGALIAEKYRIDSAIGSGAMGTIYKAEQLALGKTMVIKVLHRHLMGDHELIQRFEREARAASRLNHPNCVAVIDFGALPDGALYIAMEFIPGMDLADLIEREYPIDHRRVLHIAKQICLALDEAHANGVLHRDLKPENIMLEDRRNSPDHVKVVDFGIAKLEEANPGSRRAFETRAGIVCGTPEYMSPEQARGEKLDARSDLYALGVLLYHVVTDQLPFEGSSPIETVTMHLSETPRPPRELRGDLPEALDQLILTLLSKHRDQRPPTAMDVHAELERIERDIEALQALTESSDDKTMVDMRPISVLIDLIDLHDLQEGEAAEAAAKANGSPSSKGLPRPGVIRGGAASARTVSDTVDDGADTRGARRPLRRVPTDETATVQESPAFEVEADAAALHARERAPGSLLKRARSQAGGEISHAAATISPAQVARTEMGLGGKLPRRRERLRWWWVAVPVVVVGGGVAALFAWL